MHMCLPDPNLAHLVYIVQRSCHRPKLLKLRLHIASLKKKSTLLRSYAGRFLLSLILSLYPHKLIVQYSFSYLGCLMVSCGGRYVACKQQNTDVLRLLQGTMVCLHTRWTTGYLIRGPQKQQTPHNVIICLYVLESKRKPNWFKTNRNW